MFLLNLLKLLRLWYSRQTCAVLWNTVLGDRFNILCGVRQGGVLSPILLSTYVFLETLVMAYVLALFSSDA